MGTWEGWVGLQGRDSRLFFSLPAAKNEVEERRPDILVHEIGENVATMREEHKQAVSERSGRRNDQSRRASAWGPRRRSLSTAIR